MQVYQPAEDSLLLCKAVKNYLENQKTKNLRILDMGTGSGIQSENCLQQGISEKNITAVDLNPDALKKAESFEINTIKSNLFQNINEKYDLIIFNPPYLPTDKHDKRPDTTGGEKGDETIIKFISKLKNHLTEKGVCFFLTSSLTPEDKFKAELVKQNLQFKKTTEKNLFFEKLFVWKVAQ